MVNIKKIVKDILPLYIVNLFDRNILPWKNDSNDFSCF